MKTYNQTKEGQGRFKANKTHFYHFSKLIQKLYGSNLGAAYGEICKQMTGLKIDHIDADDKTLDVIRKNLLDAWNTEHVNYLLSGMNVSDQISANQWKIIHLYYSVYYLLRALYCVYKKEEEVEHRNVLGFISSGIQAGKISLINPWNYIYLSKSKEHFRNFPKDFSFKVSRSWEIKVPSAQNMAAWLMNTSKKKGRKKKKEIPPVSLFDCLYRMRKWSNYRAGEDILSGKTQSSFKQDVTELCEDINFVMSSTLGLLEMFIIRLIGQKQMLIIYEKCKKYFSLNSIKNDQLTTRMQVFLQNDLK